ncbi:putative hydroxymethylpyrimidine transporter CytX [Anaerofustis stercorihominis]|uniref:putative hydroxymethylpyrimidine transporter CytX n=1 Tax=Anaerofustis stercorihominis TaxID=214853 RepID=UPI00214B19F2|nr:putative hydroxymethylpyrimidine transporter CytX [Anaerofustis stercorihominis]MCR2033839.1 putative hydroxymethylpyrimidine transporter CytX [Anaerofustis stercorihominis]
MENKKTSVFDNSLIWFGAGVSIAEIMTGTLIAPLGFTKGLLAIIIGHLIGCALMYFAGIIGGKSEKSAMETVKMSFGEKGSLLFSSLNVLQLVGWTAVMIVGGAKAVSVISNSFLGSPLEALWCVIIGALIILWVVIGITNLGKVNTVAMGGLFLLTVVLSTVIFKGNIINPATGGLSFGSAVELSVAMPLSWLPLISDYIKEAKEPGKSALASVSVYFISSCWMYIIGMGAALFTKSSDIAVIMLQAGLGILGVIIIILSTVTTTFLDAYSAGVSSVSISKNLSEKKVAIIVCIVGTLLAIFTPIEEFENFLYLIGSVFAPMIAVQIADFFFLKKDYSGLNVNKTNIILWLIGFITYRVFMRIDTPVGNTLPVMIIVIILCIIINKIFGGKKEC